MKQSKICVGQSVILKVAAIVVAVASLITPVSAQKNRRGSAESEAILPQIDVIQVKESADAALRTSRDLKSENEVLTAKITQLDNRIILLSEEVSSVSSAKIEELESRLALLTEAYKDLYVKMQVLENYVSRIPVVHPPKVTPPPPPTFTTSGGDLLLSSPEYDLYQSGLRLLNGRSYAHAIRVFTECLAKFPEGVYRDRAQFWIGESYYQQSQMQLAIEAYQKVLNYPNSTMADNALFKIALAHQKLGQIERSRAEFRRLIERYPASEFVERSKKYLADLR